MGSLSHLLSMHDLDAQTIFSILDAAEGFRDISRRTIKKVPTLRGRSILTVFYEASTRTRVSFELAGKRLSADVVNISSSGSSVSKGESLQDTAQTLDAMQADAMVVRHPASGAAAFIAKYVRAKVINAGDGQHEHPTQSLLDLMTIRSRFKTFEKLEITILGDILHSRVARSNFIALRMLGAHVRVYGTDTLLPRDLREAYGCTVCSSMREALSGAQVVMTLRLQQERMTAGLLPSLREYSMEFGVNAEQLKHTHPDAIVMHPGPVNRGVELSPDVMDGKRSVILEQVENGVAIRAAVLYFLLGNDTSDV